jgi:hypothetical protein
MSVSYSGCGDYSEINAFNATSSNHLYGSSAVPNGTWYHLALVYSGTVGTLYVNGTVLGNCTTFADQSAINVTRVYNYFGYSSFWGAGDVQLDEIKLYNKALTQSQVQLDMNSVGIPSGIC